MEKVRNGEILVLSIRDAHGTPHWTIEYNRETKDLVQFKGIDNKLPNSLELVILTLNALAGVGLKVEQISEDFAY